MQGKGGTSEGGKEGRGTRERGTRGGCGAREGGKRVASYILLVLLFYVWIRDAY